MTILFILFCGSTRVLPTDDNDPCPPRNKTTNPVRIRSVDGCSKGSTTPLRMPVDDDGASGEKEKETEKVREKDSGQDFQKKIRRKLQREIQR